MKFIATEPAFIMGQYIKATIQEPAVIELPDDVSDDQVSLNWKPNDAAGAARLVAMRQKAQDIETAERQARLDEIALTTGSVAKKVKPDAIREPDVVPVPDGAVVAVVAVDPAAMNPSPVGKPTIGS